MNANVEILSNIEKMLREMIIHEAVRICKLTGFMNEASFREEINLMSNQAISKLHFEIISWYTMRECANTFEETINEVKLNKTKESKKYGNH